MLSLIQLYYCYSPFHDGSDNKFARSMGSCPSPNDVEVQVGAQTPTVCPEGTVAVKKAIFYAKLAKFLIVLFIPSIFNLGVETRVQVRVPESCKLP